jgi:transposase
MQRLRIRRTGREDPAHAPIGSWPTRPTRTRRSAPTCGDAGSRPPSRRRATSRRPASRRAPPAGRPPAFDPEAYKQRNTTERAHNRLKAFRAVAMRTDKREFVYNGTIDRRLDQDLAPHPSKRRSMRHAPAGLRPSPARQPWSASGFRAGSRKGPAVRVADRHHSLRLAPRSLEL